MFVTVVSTDDEDRDDDFVQGLNEILEDMQGAEVPGFKQAFLLRGEKRRAMVLAFWETERDAEAFLSTEAGQRASTKQERLFGDKAKRERFNLTWQARHDVAIS
jgi:heme-degrading monooxygenase HmoA